MTDGEHTRPDPLFVPVRASQPGLICLRTGRLASGLPIGLAFTSEAALLSALGPRQQWTLICEQALLDMLAPLGIGHLRIDPRLARDAARGAPECTGQAACRPGGPAPGPTQTGTPRSSRHRSSRHRSSRHRRSKHPRSRHSHHEQSRSWAVTGCASPSYVRRPGVARRGQLSSPAWG
ncbi:MAG TPA: SAV_915 family protein [Streptosporangiaceae bacterium]|nr:SAV_915 family protein [Streptosporangiaceae bacterium]